MPSLNGSPTERFKARCFAFSTNLSYILSCTNVRDPAQQHCPFRLEKIIINKMNFNFLETNHSIKKILWTNLIKEQSIVGKLHCLIYISILTYNKGWFPSKFQRYWLQIAFGCQFKNNFSCLCWSSESKLCIEITKSLGGIQALTSIYNMRMCSRLLVFPLIISKFDGIPKKCHNWLLNTLTRNFYLSCEANYI